MKSKIRIATIIFGMAIPVMAQDQIFPPPPDKQKLSYALGMNLAMQIKHSGVDPDINAIAQAIKDVLANKPTEIQESEIRMILRDAEMSGHIKLSSKYISEGESFLAKNAKEPGVTALPDGVQYRVLKTGDGEIPKRLDLLTINFRGTWVDGTEFKHNDKLEIPFAACTKGLQEALQMMKVGSKWQVYIPYTLAYGRVGDRADRFGSTLIYEVELLNAESENAHPNQHQGAGRVGHSLDEDLLPQKH